MTPPTLRLVIAGGGTGGHVSPALAVVAHLRQRLEGVGTTLTPLWLGTSDSVEQAAAVRASIPFVAIPTGKLRRYLSVLTVRDAARVPLGVLAATRVLGRFRPRVLFSTGGFVSVPAVVAAWLRGVPSLTHEQTVTVGLANRLNARLATRVALSYQASARWLPGHPLTSAPGVPGRARRCLTRAPLVVTGNPVRPEVLAGEAERGRRTLGLSPDLPVLYVTGGALGSHLLNEAVAAALPILLSRAQIVHQAGRADLNGDLPRLLRRRDDLPPVLAARYHPVEFVGSELADLFALSCLVVGRAGAGTVAELAALGKPAVLVPLAGASADEQTRNARLLADHGAAVVVPERELTSARLAAEVTALLDAPARLDQMGQAARTLARPDAAERLADELLALAGWP